MKQSWNQSSMKHENKRLVLQQIISDEPISRADLAKRCGLNKATVSSLVAELMDDSLVKEAGIGESSGGRRPVLLYFSREAGYALGLNVGGGTVEAVLTDLKGTIMAHEHFQTREPAYQSAITVMEEAVEWAHGVVPPSPHGIIGVGVAVPGMIDHSGTVLNAPNLQWRDRPLKHDLEDRLKLPVLIENEANAGAYREYQTRSDAAESLVYISIGTGIGAGIVLNGSLYRGQNGYAGEIGHMTLDFQGPRCTCGNSGCLELYASELALVEKAMEAGLKDCKDFDSLVNSAGEGDELALSLFTEAGRALGSGVVSAIHAYDTKHIIIASRGGEWMKNAVRDTVRKKALPHYRDDLDLVFLDTRLPAASLGVSGLVVDEFLKGRKGFEKAKE
ncbi:ROK family transcriptional regulator [Rossellomorea marisflavi]|uniref:ROK family transcriptional regulator n=1 Tax=Rossellomorea marisflavi TaxID=189381 RepID=UPI00296FF600|nr:ROK family transcriptional regulator [Rossellomorea marisflavi]MDW4525604.1 ROK family transcriptional regulator [Rossellomorea marisflavi]